MLNDRPPVLKKIVPILTLTLLILIIGVIWTNRSYSKNNIATTTPSVSPSTQSTLTPVSLHSRAPSTNTPAPVPTNTPAATSSKNPHADAVHAAMAQMVANYPELTLGISYIDLNSGARTDVNGATPFTAASTTKMITACLFLKDVETGTLSYTMPMGAYTADFQLQQLVNQSNNDSWDLLGDAVGWPTQETYAHQLGMNTYSEANNTMASNDMATLLQKLYQGKLLSKDNTNLLLSYMQNTNEESYIPPALSSGTKVYHKTGLLDDNVHDGAIIDNGKNPYVLVIYSNGQGFPNYDDRATAFHEIVKAIDAAANS